MQGNTLADPKFKDGDSLKTFDFVVANPPFSDKRWSNGIDPLHDPYDRFQPFGTPPAKQGDYAYLLHIVRSLKSTGKGACILPHGVLFRGNAEADIRRALVRKGYIKGIIGLPANLFYGTGIPACIVVIDKADAQARKGIFMIDASGGFMKDGPKNRLRAMDIHRIVDTFNKQIDVPKYARMVAFAEIEKNDFNLNLPRYIDSQTAEDLQDIAGHLQGGIPVADIDALERYWDVCPQLRHTLFKDRRPGYLDLAVDKAAIKPAIYEHPEFATFIAGMNDHFAAWRKKSAAHAQGLEGRLPSQGSHRRALRKPARPLRRQAAHRPVRRLPAPDGLLGRDDAGRRVSRRRRRLEGGDHAHRREGQEGQGEGQGLDLRPHPQGAHRRPLLCRASRPRSTSSASDLESVTARLAELEEEHGGDEGAFADFEKVNKATVAARLKEIQGDEDAKDEAAVLSDWLKLNAQESDLKKRLKEAEAALDAKAYAKYPKLTESEIKSLVVDDKWLAALDAAIHGEMDRVSQQLTQRVKELAERYETPLPQMVDRVTELESKVNCHLEKMGFSWT